MNSINKNDCLTCAFTNALQISYKSVFYTFKLLGINLLYLPDRFMNMHSYSTYLARFSKRPMVVIYLVSNHYREAHAVAFINGKCIDNNPDSSLNNITYKELTKRKNILHVWRHNQSMR